ncbi:hypothetical protein PF003_g2860 [Phytophthora fragariae]|nr:hypothetical protein PF003_g2860 [Phytophthora fragariae]
MFRGQFLRLLLLLVTGSEFCSEERYGCPCEGEGCSNCDPCDIVAKVNGWLCFEETTNVLPLTQ